ncbi:MAG: glycosyltransferase [Gammaproteobacteria bacterium]|nr:glycosyltransferase [Gammaproteobacteria bacterium]
MNREPLISICVPTFNSAHWLPGVVTGVLQQSYPHFELLIVDDCSSDESFEVVAPWLERDSRLHYRRLPQNLGAVGNAEECTREARGELVTILQSDDRYCHPHFLSRAVAAFSAEDDLAFFYSALWYLNREDQRIQLDQPFDDDFVLPGEEALRLMMLRGGLWPSTVVYRGDLFREVGGFRADIGVGQDLYCAYHHCLRGKVAHWAEPALEARLHPDSVTLSYGKRLFTEFERVLQLFRSEGGAAAELAVAMESRAEAMRGNYAHLGQGDYRQQRARQLLRQWGASGARIIIYGAGQHTRDLLQQTVIGEARVVALTDSDRSLYGGERWGYPVVSLQEALSMGGDVVLISSAFHQDAIGRQLQRLLPSSVTMVPFYEVDGEGDNGE